MKRTVLCIIFTTLLLSIAVQSPTTALQNDQLMKIDHHDLDSEISMDQEFISGTHYPFLTQLTYDNGTEVTQVRERNETNGDGAMFLVDSYTNVTFQYAIALSNDTTFQNYTYSLFADLPVVNGSVFNNTFTNSPLSLTNSSETIDLIYSFNSTGNINYTLPYDPSLQIQNATIFFYETTIAVNITSSYIPFYVKHLTDSTLDETKNGQPYNLLTTQQYWNTSSQDEFYIQRELVNVTASIYNGIEGQDIFGFKYKKQSSSSDQFVDANFTLTYNGVNATGFNYTQEYEPGTTFEWVSYAILNDSLTNLTRRIEMIEHKFVEIGDGTPELSSEVLSTHPQSITRQSTIYSQNFTIRFNATADVPKGEITELRLDPGNGSSDVFFVPGVNQSLSGDELTLVFDYTSNPNGKYNASITATTDKDLNVTKSFLVVLDNINPTLNLNRVSERTVVSTNPQVELSFSFNDETSGIRRAYIDMGDGTIYEVTNMSSIKHTYRNFGAEEQFILELTVEDWAGNIDTDTEIVTVQFEEIGETSSPTLEFWIFMLVLILVLLTPFYGSKVVDFFNNLR